MKQLSFCRNPDMFRPWNGCWQPVGFSKYANLLNAKAPKTNCTVSNDRIERSLTTCLHLFSTSIGTAVDSEDIVLFSGR